MLPQLLIASHKVILPQQLGLNTLLFELVSFDDILLFELVWIDDALLFELVSFDDCKDLLFRSV